MYIKIKALFPPNTFYMEKECIVENLIHFFAIVPQQKYIFFK